MSDVHAQAVTITGVRVGYTADELANALARINFAPDGIGLHQHGRQEIAVRHGRIEYLADVPRLHERHHPRFDELAALRERLVRFDKQEMPIRPTSRAVGLLGMGGIGKTELAAALMQDEVIRSAFYGGLIWLTLGRDADVAAKQAELIFALSGHRVLVKDSAEGRNELGILTRQLSGPTLLVLDDLWQLEAADGFSGLGPSCLILVTTRIRGVLERLDAQEYEVSALAPEEAREFFASALGVSKDALPRETNEVLQRCGHLPLAVAAVAALLRKQVFTWTDIITALRNGAVEHLKTPWLQDREQRNVATVLKVSLDGLSDQARTCFRDFGIFPEDAAVPEPTLMRLWSDAAGGELEAKLLAQDLVDRSMLRRNLRRQYLIHDLFRDYLRQSDADLEGRHSALLKRYWSVCKSGWATGPDDGYFFQNLPWHLAELGRLEEVQRLLFEFDWLQRKLVTAGLAGLVSDCSFLNGHAEVAWLARILRLSAHTLLGAPHQLAGQLCGRLVEDNGPLTANLLASARASLSPGLMVPRTNGYLDHPTALVRIFKGHADGISKQVLLPGGRRALSGSDDCTLRIWDLESGGSLRVLAGHSGPVRTVALSTDGCQALSGAKDGTMRLWDLETGATLNVFGGHSGPILTSALLSDGRRALSGSEDSTLRLWDLETGATLKVFEGHSGSVTTSALLSDGRRVLSGSSDSTLRLWDLETGATLKVFEGHSKPVYQIVALSDGRRALSGSLDNTVRLWDLATASTQSLVEGDGELPPFVETIAALSDGRRALWGCLDGTLRLWDLETGLNLGVLQGDGSPICSISTLADGRRIVSGSLFGNISVWDLDSQKCLNVFEGHTRNVYGLSVLPGDRQVLSGSGDKTLRLWDLEAGSSSEVQIEHRRAIHFLQLQPGRKVVSASLFGPLELWDVDSGSYLRAFSDAEGWFGALDLSPDRRTFLSGSWDEMLRLWSVEAGAILKTFEGHKGRVNTVAFLPDGKRALTGSEDSTLRLWDLETGLSVSVLEGHSAAVNAVAVWPDGRKALSGSSDKTLRLWDLETGTSLAVLVGHTAGIKALAVSPDGRKALSGSHDGTLRVWDLGTGATLRKLDGHAGAIRAITLLPDGQRAVSGSDDNTVRLWNITSGREIASFMDDHSITCCVAAANTGPIIAANMRGRILVFDLPSTGTSL